MVKQVWNSVWDVIVLKTKSAYIDLRRMFIRIEERTTKKPTNIILDK